MLFNSLQCFFYGFWIHTHTSQIYLTMLPFSCDFLSGCSFWKHLFSRFHLTSNAQSEHWRSFSFSVCKETLLKELDHQCIKEYAAETSQVSKSALKSTPLHWKAVFTIWPERRFDTWKKDNSYTEQTQFTTLGLASHDFRSFFNISP